MKRNPFALDRRSRVGLGITSAACIAAAFALTPLEVRSERARPGAGRPPVVITTNLRPPAAVVPVGDPFAVRVIDVADDAALAQPAMARLGALPANAGAGSFPFGPNAVRSVDTMLEAVVLGPRPAAVVERGGSTRIVSVGDVLDGARVEAIGATGIVLSGGARVELQPSGAAR